MKRDGEFTHGTRSAMRNYGCHCEACQEGNALNQRELRQRRRAAAAFVCPDCRISYYERWNLAKHRRGVHGDSGQA